jgi:hypothetical protein
MPTAVEFTAFQPAFTLQQPGTLNGIIIVSGLGGLANVALLPAVLPAPRG